MAFQSAAPQSNSGIDDSNRAAVLVGAEQLLRIALVATLTTTGSGPGIRDKDVVPAVKTEDLYGAHV